MQLKSYIINAVFFTLLILPVGCATQRTKPYIGETLSDKQDIDYSKILDLSFPEVKESIRTKGLSFTTLKAKADIMISGTDINGEFRCNGIVRFQKPGKIRVIGSKLTRTVFDMLSDGMNYWFYLPKEKVVYTGECDNMEKPKSNAYLFPDDIAAILEHDRLFEGRQSFMETWPTFWLVLVLDNNHEVLTPYRKLKINRIDGTLTELTMYKPDSCIRAQAYLSNYTNINGQTIPETVRINWPETNTTLTFNLKNIATNEYLKPEIFDFRKPGKARIIDVN